MNPMRAIAPRHRRCSVPPVPLNTRTSTRVSVNLHAEIAAGPLLLSCPIRDISMSGMYLVSDYHFPVGTSCQIQVDIDETGRRQRIEVESKIVRIDNAGMAAEMLELDRDSFKTLRQLVQSRSQTASRIGFHLRKRITLR